MQGQLSDMDIKNAMEKPPARMTAGQGFLSFHRSCMVGAYILPFGL